MASVLVPDVSEHQRMHALPAPLGKADPLRSQPALLDINPAGLREERGGVCPIGPIVVGAAKRGEVVNERRRLLQVRGLQLADLGHQEVVGADCELLHEAARLACRR